jgi:hypothetical protein
MIDIEKLAREAGFVAYGEDCGEYRIPTPAFKHRMEWFAALVRNEVLEEAVEALRKEYMTGTKPTFLYDLEASIRSLKEKT